MPIKKIKSDAPSGRTSKKYCPDCGFRVHCLNHNFEFQFNYAGCASLWKCTFCETTDVRQLTKGGKCNE